MKVIRWSKEIISANDIHPQLYDWGGYNANVVCFTPCIDENDDMYKFWYNSCSKQHYVDLVPNWYNLDLSFIPYNTEEKLIELVKQAYKDSDIFTIMKNEYGIYLTLADINNKLRIAEIRLYTNTKIKIS